MPRTRPPYPPEFREQIVEMVRAGRTPEELAREFEPSVESIRQGLEGGDPAGSGDLAVVGERLHPSPAEGMEAVRP
jgi:transposase-like protein